MSRKILYDPSFWMLLLLNGYCLYYFDKHPEGFKTVVWIYWVQSVLIGFFNFLDLLTMKNGNPGSLNINDKPYDGSTTAKGCSAFFFLFHYNVFHLVYAVFVVIQVKGPLDVQFLALSALIIFIECVIGFIRNKRLQNSQSVNVGFVFVMPYVRITPMHMMILLPGFLGMKASMIFLVLKTISDIAMYLLARTLYTSKGPKVNELVNSNT